jgi:Domain of unknown function (DUF1902)
MSTTTISIGRRTITVDARWDNEAGVWIATGKDVDGLMVEANTWSAMIEEIELVAPDLLEVMSMADASCPDVR